jgi:YD repeat-containing protein
VRANPYDRSGNRWQQNGPFTSLRTFDSKNHNLPTDGITFDAAGNVLTYNNGVHTYNYTYDAENRLATVDTTVGVYTYDAEGRRIRRVVSGVVSDCVYDLAGHPSGNNWFSCRAA